MELQLSSASWSSHPHWILEDDDDDEDGISMELQRLVSVEQDLRHDLVHAELEWKSGRDFFSWTTTTTTTTPTSVSSSPSCLPTSQSDEPLVPLQNEQQQQEQPLVSVVTLEEEDETEAETLSQESGDQAEPEDNLYPDDHTDSAVLQPQRQQPQGWSFALAADA